MVLRRESFAGHTLSVMAFPGATGAVLIGLPAAAGYFTFCGASALVIGSSAGSGSRRHRGEESAVTGAVQAFGLACGFLFLSLYQGVLAGYENVLFGDFLGITRGQVLLLTIVAVLTLAFFAVAGRPLLFASVDEAVARASGVPVRALSLLFLLVLGLAVAATAQITGVLLVFALLVAPAATAQLITAADRRELATDGGPRRRDHVGRARARVLLQLPRRLLHHDRRVRRLRCRADRPCRRRPSDAPAPPPACRGGGRLMFAHEFVRNAFLAGTVIALACGLVGYFVVLRAQVFAGDALTHVAFTGAIAAAAAGIDPRIGLFAATIMIGLVLGALGQRAHADDVTIGIIFAWILGLGVLFLALFSSGSGGGNGILGARTLFGSIFGLSAADARLAAVIGVAIIAAILAIARPLLFSSVDPAVAAARGVPVRTLGLLFLALLGATAAEATQAIGALLLLGLIAAPAGAAHRITANPYLAMSLSGVLAVLCTWAGLTISYLIPKLPPSSAIIAVASAIYLLAYLFTTDLRALRPSLALNLIRGTET